MYFALQQYKESGDAYGQTLGANLHFEDLDIISPSNVDMGRGEQQVRCVLNFWNVSSESSTLSRYDSQYFLCKDQTISRAIHTWKSSEQGWTAGQIPDVILFVLTVIHSD